MNEEETVSETLNSLLSKRGDDYLLILDEGDKFAVQSNASSENRINMTIQTSLNILKVAIRDKETSKERALTIIDEIYAILKEEISEIENE